MIRALIWKEWREQRWRLVFGCVLLMGTTAIGLRAHMLSDFVLLLMLLVLLGGFVLPLLAAIEATGTSREEGTVAFSASLPAGAQKVFCVKACMALATVLIPIAGAVAVALAMAVDRDMPARGMLLCGGIGVWIGVSVLLWTMAFGATQPTEARVGIVGMAVIGVWSAYLAVIETFFSLPTSTILSLPDPLRAVHLLEFSSRTPGRPEYARDLRILIALLVTQILILIALWLWAAKRNSTSVRTHS